MSCVSGVMSVGGTKRVSCVSGVMSVGGTWEGKRCEV